MNVSFASPGWLSIGVLAVVSFFLLALRAERLRRRAIAVLAAAGPETSVAQPRRWLRHGLAIAAVGLACIALARPRAGFRLEAAPHRGVDLMFAVDTSKSMRAADLRPDRLTRAKLAVADLVRTFDGDRVGLIAFAGDAFVQAPMTVDRTVFLESLDALDTDVIPTGGTDVASAIRAAVQAMGSEPDHAKVLVLLSDGEDLAGNALAAARDAAREGLTIYTVGVGSRQGELVEVPGADGAPELVRDEHGQPVRSRLDEAMLKSLAQVTGGAYQPLGADGRGLAALYAVARTRLPVHDAAGTTRKVYTERFQIPLALALACLAAEMMLGDRRRRTRARRLATTAAAALAVGLLPGVATAAPAPVVSSYNDGTATYRAGDFAAAQRAFEAALHTDDVKLQADAYYDLGNARYRAGQATQATDRAATIEMWKQAIAAYDAALALTRGDADATFNRALVARRLAALEQQQKEENDKKNEGKNERKNEGKNDQKQSQNGQAQPAKSQSGQGQKQSGQGQQSKDQTGQGQQSKDQTGQGQQSKDQTGQGQQSQDHSGHGQQAQDHSGQGQQAKDQTGQGPSQSQAAQQPQHQGSQGPQSTQASQQAQNQGGQAPRPNAPSSSDERKQPGPAPSSSDAQPSRAGDRGTDAAATPPDPSASSSTGAPDAARRADGSSKPGTVGVAGGQAARADARASAAADARRRAAGQLTRGEAVQLLDSVEDDLKPLPIHGRADGHPDHPAIKDW